MSQVVYSKRLEFIDSRSFKEYRVEVVEIGVVKHGGKLCNVEFAYGRIGSSLNRGVKNTAPIPLEKAIAMADKLANSKIKKGYVLTQSFENAVPDPASVPKPPKAPSKGLKQLPQLSNPTTEEKLMDAIGYGINYLAQTKYDGVRKILEMDHGTIRAYNRRGIEVTVSPSVARDFEAFCVRGNHQSIMLDGEDLGDNFVAFDLLEYNNEDIRWRSFRERVEKLLALGEGNDDLLLCAPTRRIDTFDDLTNFIDEKRTLGEEGIIFKSPDAPYESGRPSVGGASLKLKFWETATVRVKGRNEDKRSVVMEVMANDGNWVECGSCTIPANQAIPNDLDRIEVRYLWTIKNGDKGVSALIQPSFIRNRSDELDEDACVASQLVVRDDAIVNRSVA